jgi:hypothetical protein
VVAALAAPAIFALAAVIAVPLFTGECLGYSSYCSAAVATAVGLPLFGLSRRKSLGSCVATGSAASLLRTATLFSLPRCHCRFRRTTAAVELLLRCRVAAVLAIVAPVLRLCRCFITVFLSLLLHFFPSILPLLLIPLFDI